MGAGTGPTLVLGNQVRIEIPPNGAALEVLNGADPQASIFRLGSDGQLEITIELDDDDLLTLGADGDQAMVNRSSALAANTALTGALIGTPAVAAIPANSLIVSNVTADGDQVFATVPASGSNSIEWLRNDASAGLTVFNEAAGDIDLRVEGDTNANMLVIDAGTDSAAIGSAVVAGAALSIGNTTGRTVVTAVGNQLHIPALSFTDGGATGTIADLRTVNIGAQTVLATNTITYTVAVGLNVENPVASTGATFTNIRSIRAAGNIQIGAASAFGMTQPTAALVIKTGTAPAGAVTTSVALFTDGTTMKKIIADGTVSDVQT